LSDLIFVSLVRCDLGADLGELLRLVQQSAVTVAGVSLLTASWAVIAREARLRMPDSHNLAASISWRATTGAAARTCDVTDAQLAACLANDILKKQVSNGIN
jgi:hypothetical protein